MLKLHVKTTYPAGVKMLPTLGWYQDILAPLNAQTNLIIIDAPDVRITETDHLRIDTFSSLEDVKTLLISRNQTVINHPEIAEYRATNNVTRVIKIEDDNGVVLDWTPLTDLPQTEFVNWINTTIV
jgi:hypothetical protein